jgi:hypothetical protein
MTTRASSLAALSISFIHPRTHAFKEAASTCNVEHPMARNSSTGNHTTAS